MDLRTEVPTVTAPATGQPAEAVAEVDRLYHDGSKDSHAAIANALKLGSSLVATLVIAIAMKFLMPRYLGPTRFGTLSFADGFTGTFFVTLSLGAESYIRKEVSVRLAHASDFLGGTLVLRAAMSVAIFGIMAMVMNATGRSREVRQLVYLFGAAQFFVSVNGTLSALLHARGRVGGMSCAGGRDEDRVGRRSGRRHRDRRRAVGVCRRVPGIREHRERRTLCSRHRHLGLVFRVDAAPRRR
jgi:hypothetical protein